MVQPPVECAVLQPTVLLLVHPVQRVFSESWALLLQEHCQPKVTKLQPSPRNLEERCTNVLPGPGLERRNQVDRRSSASLHNLRFSGKGRTSYSHPYQGLVSPRPQGLFLRLPGVGGDPKPDRQGSFFESCASPA